MLQYHQPHNPIMLNIDCNASTSVWTLKVNPLTGSVAVRWFKGCLTEYTFKARKRDILALLIAGDRSIGQWVNYHMPRRYVW